jgi:hypothetical protein
MKRFEMSPAMGVALLALFVALGGTGYAVSSLPRNSVGPKQLRTGAVTTKKLKRRSVTASRIAPNALSGSQILESGLGMVPAAARASSAGHADSAGTASTLAGAGPSAFVGAKRMAFGTGAATSPTEDELINLSELGVTVTTDGDSDTQPNVNVHLPTGYWYVMDENAGFQMFSLPSGGLLTLTAQAEVSNVRSSYVSALIWQISPERGMYLRCVFDTHGFTSSRPLACWALRV